jgi:pimeloyl-ACP methyl ester carboxylesterase
MPFVTARDGQRLHVRVFGRGRPVLLLHGLGSSSLQWMPFTVPLLRAATFYVPDFRGHGRSVGASLNQADMFQNHMEDVEDVVRHYGLRDLLLAGHSMGASTALHWQRAGGFARVRRYMHIDQSPCVGNRDDWSHGLLGPEQEAYFGDLRRLAELLRPHTRCERVAALPPEVRGPVLELLSHLQARLGLGLTAALLRGAARWPALVDRLPVGRPGDLYRIATTYLAADDYRESLRQCAVPVTVVVGMRSVLYAPAGQMAIAEYAPRCQVVRFEKAGHLVPLDEPLGFARVLARFLED